MKPNCNPFFSFIFSFLHFTIHMNWMSLVDVTSSSSSSNTQNNTTEFPFRQDNYRFEMNSIALAFIYVCQDAMRIRYAKCHLRVGTFACEVREWKWWNPTSPTLVMMISFAWNTPWWSDIVLLDFREASSWLSGAETKAWQWSNRGFVFSLHMFFEYPSKTPRQY